MRFAKKDIYVEDGERRVVAALKGQPVPAHYDHLVDAKDTTDTPPSPASTAAAATDASADPEARDEAEVDFVEKLKQGEDHELILLAAVLNSELDDRGLNKPEPVEIPEDVTPGETPGWPIDPDTEEPYDLPESVRKELASAAEPAAADYGSLNKGVLEELIQDRTKVLTEINGTGKGGNVLAEDLAKALADCDATQAPE